MKKIINALSIAVIIGFILGFSAPLAHITANRYIQYKMFRLVAIHLQRYLNRWIALTIIILFVLSVVSLVAKFIWKSFTSNVGKGHAESEGKLLAFLENGSRMKLIKKTAISIVLFLVILNISIVIDSKMNIAGRPNVILVVCETLRADHLGCYGYERDTTKNIDSFANDTFTFKNAYAQAPSTMPSMWNIVTSKYQSPYRAKDECVTIAEYFKSNNYRTGAFLSHHYFEGTKANLQQGFDVYDAKCKKDNHKMSARPAKSITESTIKWIEQNRKKPFFVWLVYFDPHDPYVPPAEFRGHYNKEAYFSRDRRAQGIGYRGTSNHLVSKAHRQFLINAYDEEIRYFDHQIGRLFSYLKRSGQYDNSIIILTADHGEELGDNGGRWDHCQLLSQEEIWVPLLIKMPYKNKKVEIENTVQTIDIYPTLTECLKKVGIPNYYNTFEGKSLTPLLNGEQLDDVCFAASFWRNQLCIVMGNYKYWTWGNREYLTNIKTGEVITDSTIRKKLKSTLTKVCNQYLTDKNYYARTVENLKSIGYLR